MVPRRRWRRGDAQAALRKFEGRSSKFEGNFEGRSCGTGNWQLIQMFNRRLIATFALLAMVLAGGRVSAQNAVGLAEPGDPTSAKPGILSKIAIDQRIGHALPLDAAFVDDHGKSVRLGDYFGKRPVVLALVYYECPMLCTQVLNGLVSSLGTLNLTVGKEFDVVAVSFNPKEGPGLASQKKANYVERYGRPDSADGWHFLTGTQESIDPRHRSGGVQVRARQGNRPVRARRGDRSDDAEGHDSEVLLRHRVLAARPAARPGRGGRRAHRHGDRRPAAVLLPLRPGVREVRADGARDGAGRRQWRRSRRLRRS